MKKVRNCTRALFAAGMLMLCLLLASCGGVRSKPVHIQNASGRDVTAYLAVQRDGRETLMPLNGYTLAAGANEEVSVSSSAMEGLWFVYLKDNAGGRWFFSSVQVPRETGEAISLTLRLEGELMALDIDWGSGAAQTFTSVSSAEAQYTEFCRWAYLDVATYEEFKSANFWLFLPGYNDAKWEHVFGANGGSYASKEEASQHMVKITFPIWKLSGSKKVSSSASMWINSAVADDVVKIFTEIYNDPEQFPINSVGGYSWRGDNSSSEHNPGLAIDINPNENYQIRYGNVVVGSFWDPSASPYSIAENSSVVRIFAEHGWEWGGNAWAGYTSPSTQGNHDYMHFSYFGT